MSKRKPTPSVYEELQDWQLGNLLCSPAHERLFLEDGNTIQETLDKCGDDLKKYLQSTKPDGRIILNVIGEDVNGEFRVRCVNLVNGNRRVASLLCAASLGKFRAIHPLLVRHLGSEVEIRINGVYNNEMQDQWVPRSTKLRTDLLWQGKPPLHDDLGWNLLGNLPYDHEGIHESDRGRPLQLVAQGLCDRGKVLLRQPTIQRSLFEKGSFELYVWKNETVKLVIKLEDHEAERIIKEYNETWEARVLIKRCPERCCHEACLKLNIFAIHADPKKFRLFLEKLIHSYPEFADLLCQKYACLQH